VNSLNIKPDQRRRRILQWWTEAVRDCSYVRQRKDAKTHELDTWDANNLQNPTGSALSNLTLSNNKQVLICSITLHFDEFDLNYRKADLFVGLTLFFEAQSKIRWHKAVVICWGQHWKLRKRPHLANARWNDSTGQVVEPTRSHFVQNFWLNRIAGFWSSVVGAVFSCLGPQMQIPWTVNRFTATRKHERNQVWRTNTSMKRL